VLGAWSTTASNQGAGFDRVEQCTGPLGNPPCFLYVWIQGTSMATPHVSGVAALIISQYGDPDMEPTQVEQILQISANNQPCPSPNTVIAGPGFVFPTSTCHGGVGENGFYGKGIVDAVKAVTLH
jgi:lantibiotic leader peptide-processing serine protease